MKDEKEKKTVKTSTKKNEKAKSSSKKVTSKKKAAPKKKTTTKDTKPKKVQEQTKIEEAKVEEPKEETVIPVIEESKVSSDEIKVEAPLKKEEKRKKKENTFRTSEVILLVIITCVVSIAMGSFITKSILSEDSSKKEEISEDLNEFIENYNYIKELYKDSINEEDLVEGALKGLLEAVGDPYAGFISDDTRFNQELAGSLYGIGIEIINDSDGNIVLYNVFEDGPAGRAGLQKGDILISINDLDLTNTSTSVLSEYIKDDTITEYQLKYKRNGEEQEVSLKREYVMIPSVFKKVYEENGKKVGYLQITIFSATTSIQFEEKLKELEEEGIDRLIIDVRDNSGGRLDAVTEILSTLLDSKHVIYQIEKDGVTEKHYSDGKETKEYPIAVLVNGSSASASEILASALNEQVDAEIVGKTTYGKGTVQQVKKLSNGEEYKVTTSKWFTSKGTWLNGKGLTPTEEVEQNAEYYTNQTDENDAQLQKALEILTK